MLSPALNGYQPERVVQFYQDLLENIRSLAGCEERGIRFRSAVARVGMGQLGIWWKGTRPRMAKMCRRS